MQKYPMFKKAEPFPEPKFNYVGFFIRLILDILLKHFLIRIFNNLFNIILHCEG